MKRALVLGAGFAGCMYAKVLKEQGWDVVVVERLPFSGGGVRTFFYGGHPYTLGPRHFLSPHEKAFSYLNELVPMRHLNKINYSYQEKEDLFVTYPIHEDDIPLFSDAGIIREELDAVTGLESESKNFEEFWVGRVGNRLYERYIRDYNKKAWLLDDNKEMDFGFEGTVKARPLERGDRYEYRDWFNAYPISRDGYNAFFDIALQDVEVRLSTSVIRLDIEEKRADLDTGDTIKFDLLVSSTSPDVLMDYELGPLAYVGREFHKFVLPTPQVFPEDVYFIYYPGADVSQTRIVEYKKFTLHESANTLLIMELPSSKNRLYPSLKTEEVERADAYLRKMPDYVLSVGRMGQYRYVDIDDIIMDALQFAGEL